MESLTGLKMQATSQKVIFSDIWDLCGEGYHYKYHNHRVKIQWKPIRWNRKELKNPGHLAPPTSPAGTTEQNLIVIDF